MNSLYNNAVNQSQTLRRELELFSAAPESAPLSLQAQISATLTSFTKTIDEYAAAAKNELKEEKKQKAELRIQKFRAELSEARESYKQAKSLREDMIHNSNRQELFGRRPQASENPYSTENQFASAESINRQEGLLKENDALGRVSQQLDEFLERGRLLVGDLSDQNSVLKGTQRAINQVGSTVGLSNETIRLVEKRAVQDKWIFYAGFLVLIGCFYLIIRYL